MVDKLTQLGVHLQRRAEELMKTEGRENKGVLGSLKAVQKKSLRMRKCSISLTVTS